MHKVNRNCPICKQNGKDTPLELRQINLTEAVYICEDRNCIYPIGFQWEYVENNILEDSDESSDDSITKTGDKKLFDISITQIDTSNTCNNSKPLNTNSSKPFSTNNSNLLSTNNSIILNTNNSILLNTNNSKLINTNNSNPLNTNNSNILLFEKYKKFTNEGTTSDSKEKINIISNIGIKNPRQLRSINKKNVKTNEIFTKPTESIRKNNLRSCNKTKPLHVSGALPESVVENAKALSEYFSSTTNRTKKSKRSIKTVFDIIQPTPIPKQEVLTLNEKSDEVLTEEDKNLIIMNTSIDHNYSIKKDDDLNDSNFIESFFENSIKNEQVKQEDGLTASFDELLFNDDKCDIKNQSLDLSEMDDLLSFL